MKSIIHAIDKTVESLLILLMAFIALLALMQVLGRFTPLPFSSWYEELMNHAFFWSTMTGGVLGVRKAEHMGVDFFTSLLGKKRQVYVELWCHTVTLLCSGYLSYLSYRFILQMRRSRIVTSGLQIPVWVICTGLVAGFGLIAIASFVEVLSNSKAPDGKLAEK